MKIDKEIFRDMVKFYGDVLHLPPLAAKIYSYLIFDFDRNGVSFDEVVEIFSASKSAVSSNLNLLLNLNIITDFNKIDERKRFFVMNEKYMKIRFEEIIEKMESELSILNKLKDFRNTIDEEALRKFTVYADLFEKNISNIKETIDQL
ncbi:MULTISPECIES: transcriptional regulator [unclassified Kaistella]|uniref:transcriptional regulator n=1 Tax=unclassified Kaistella TaxID=2762626 RepID=UPI002736D604|nr:MULTISPECIES: transcriptional regulator [unclassified Kaistella]MCZ2083513.1 transcriptional regulator [Flavobacteriales bacterium]MDP2455001.1 transcriptional regulator [Kaistella sp. SH11-4b]MDP2456016.1 transcriptional regulator [Kaistella sp. SH40-3]MDP2460671.1 transcriptional regulator [Kaistella sp. SH19-2b]